MKRTQLEKGKYENETIEPYKYGKENYDKGQF
jgi:hypothetical protein